MEQRIDITNLSIDEIVKKIKLLKSDDSVSMLSLSVKRKENGKSFGFGVGKNVRPSNVENRIRQKKLARMATNP